MSAFVVNIAHIDTLITAALFLDVDSTMYLPGYPEPDPERPGQYIPHFVNTDTADRYGAILLAENIASVAYRYPDCPRDALPGPIPTPDPAAYTAPMTRRPADPVQVLKAIQSYQYQSCEHPGWATSLAKRFCDALTAKAIRNLPGYADAAWSIADAA